MENLKIFRASHGEGKTRWLFEQAATAYDSGNKCYFYGKYDSFKKIWENSRHESCPVEFRDHMYNIDFENGNVAVFVDDIFANSVSHEIVKCMKFNGAKWYVTVNSENFVN